jgi:hypothetical protein
MMRFNRWLSPSSFSRGFLAESLGRAIVFSSSRAPISLKFLNSISQDFADWELQDLADWGSKWLPARRRLYE